MMMMISVATSFGRVDLSRVCALVVFCVAPKLNLTSYQTPLVLEYSDLNFSQEIAELQEDCALFIVIIVILF